VQSSFGLETTVRHSVLSADSSVDWSLEILNELKGLRIDLTPEDPFRRTTA
jgi:hypothetical protein